MLHVLPGGARPSALSAPATQPAPELHGAVTRFEGLVTAQMLGAMRAAKLDDGLFEGSVTEQWRSLSDQILAERLAAAAPLGLARQLEGTAR